MKKKYSCFPSDTLLGNILTNDHTARVQMMHFISVMTVLRIANVEMSMILM